MQNPRRASSLAPDKPVARCELWLARLAVLATGAALLATSSPANYYTFSKTVTGPQVELTAAAPSARFRVTGRAFQLAPNEKPVDAATVTLAGTILQSGEPRFVTARVTNSDGSRGSELSVLTQFSLASSLGLSGDCEKPGQGVPCEGSFLVDLERSDGGTAGGSVTVSWSLDLHAETLKEKSPSEGPLELPWSVEITRQ